MSHQISLSIGLSPTGHLHLFSEEDSQELLTAEAADKIKSLFSLNEGVALLRLGLTVFNAPLPCSLYFWKQFAGIFIAQACKQNPEQLAFPMNDINDLINQAPFLRGIDYLSLDVAQNIWQRLINALGQELKPYEGKLEKYLSAFDSAWNTVGRLCFHLAENKNNQDFPFAFLATYTTGLSAKHLPLGRALEEYAGEDKKSLLLSLLLPVQRASDKSSFLRTLVESGDIFKTLIWDARNALQFLKEIPLFEAAGVIVRVPNWWSPKKPPRPSISISIGENSASQVGMDALLDFNMHYALPDGEHLSSDEFEHLLASAGELVQIKGQWVQVDADKLKHVLSHWKMIERQVKQNGLSFAEGLRMLAGVQGNQTEILPEEIAQWSTVIEGGWLSQTLLQLRDPNLSGETKIHSILAQHLNAKLRPYQQRGLQWLWCLYHLRLGGCLADDMGLGKTVQVIGLLLLVKHAAQSQGPHLLVLPASLLGNWQAEIDRFSPGLRIWIAHGSNSGEPSDLNSIDVVMTTYATLHRLSWISEGSWDMVILDEAQAIKNPNAKQTRAIKLLKSRVRLALTGTPIENRLLDLWSLFDFVSPGLLGSSKVFSDYGKHHAAIRRLVEPYILRRLKSDKKIISDLPDKTEMQTYCTLTQKQIVLYQQAVNELIEQLKQQKDGIQRRGLVLSYLMRFKQICNHPMQWLGHGDYDDLSSGKFLRLKEICETIALKQEKVLVFSQFREIIPILNTYMAKIFGREGLFLHGQTSVKDRSKRVEAFQNEQGPPFFILSLKAGGTGLNLTAASHVIHFDRWWNPAVENQATDRAYRIGQNKNVLVHKFICRGTIEEKIDFMIESKKSLADQVITGEDGAVLTELSDDELLKVVTLDIHRAIGEQ